MKKTIALLTLLVAFLPAVATAQTSKAAAAPKAEAILIYYDDETQIQLTDASQNPIVVNDGISIPLNTVIKTLKTSAEIQLRPNKSIIKIAPNTTFKITALKEENAPGSNDFSLAAGKIRAVAAKVAGVKDPVYNIKTPTANCGVRGTDFAMKYDPAASMDWVCVQEGQVDFTNTVTGETVQVAGGQFANTFDPVLAASAVSADRLATLFSDVGFLKLNPTDVPGKEIPAVTQQASPAPAPAPEAGPADPATETKPEAAAEDPMMTVLKKLFGLEVGSVTIRGITYSKAVLSPVVAFDGFKLGLYLPIVYTSDMFNPKDWYRPAGNDEWSFGADKKGLWSKTADIVSDLALKIKYLEWGVQGADPFYLKVGNLKTMTLGHGTVVRNFANDQDFPAIRKVGLNAGLKVGPVALEGMADDLGAPSVVGGRFAVDLIGDQVALGAQTTADLHLADTSDLAQNPGALGTSASAYGDPLLLVGGLDLQLFKLDAGAAFRTTAFADANSLALYYRQTPTIAGLSQGLDLTPAFHDGQPGSYGGETGFYGNVVLVNYRLSFQAEKGLYTNGIFQGNYYRTRTVLLNSLVNYTLASADGRAAIDETLNMGVFGSFGFDVGILSLEGAYRWPFELRADGTIGPSKSDYLRVKLDIPKDKIPFVNLSGGISYERTRFVPSIQDKVNLFDANTVFKGEVVYGLAQGMDLVVGITTSTLRSTSGELVYENGKPKVGPTVSIDTKVSL